ncbi:MAG: NAD-dependent epimerase/dehydratase family protein [Spirochaetales bacterium]|nr:NAD-dependent epimerase/dehydratase family protein [Spirochaetales bacterium]
MKKAFITGGTGFLGINLIEELAEKEWEITIRHLPGDDPQELSHFNIVCTAGDILDYESLLKAMPGGEVVIVFHLAGDTTMWPRQAERQYRINVLGTADICRASMERGIGRLIHTPSSSAFGFHSEQICERTVSNALTSKMNYNKTKYLAEQEVKKAVNYLLRGVEASFREIFVEIYKLLNKRLSLKVLSAGKLRTAMYGMRIKALYNGKEPLITWPKYKRLTGNLFCDDSKARMELNFTTTSIGEMLSDCRDWLRKEGRISD